MALSYKFEEKKNLNRSINKKKKKSSSTWKQKRNDNREKGIFI